MPSLGWHTLDIGEKYVGKGHANPLHIVSEDEYHYPIADNTFDIVLSGQGLLLTACSGYSQGFLQVGEKFCENILIKDFPTA